MFVTILKNTEQWKRKVFQFINDNKDTIIINGFNNMNPLMFAKNTNTMKIIFKH